MTGPEHHAEAGHLLALVDRLSCAVHSMTSRRVGRTGQGLFCIPYCQKLCP